MKKTFFSLDSENPKNGITLELEADKEGMFISLILCEENGLAVDVAELSTSKKKVTGAASLIENPDTAEEIAFTLMEYAKRIRNYNTAPH